MDDVVLMFHDPGMFCLTVLVIVGGVVVRLATAGRPASLVLQTESDTQLFYLRVIF